MMAFDLSRYQRLIGVDAGRIQGEFYVLGGVTSEKVWIRPINLTIWNEHRTAGRVFYSNDFSASVEGDKVNLPKRMITPSLLADVEDVWDELMVVLVKVAEAFEEGVESKVEWEDPRG